MILSTNRLHLRLLTMDDAQDLLSIFGDKDVMHYSRIGAMNIDQIKKSLRDIHLKSYADNGFGMYAVIQKNDNKLIGIAGFLLQRIDGELHIELAYRFAKQHWGYGFATEAALELKKYAYGIIKVPRLISIIAPLNKASMNVAQKIGMVLWKETKSHDVSVLIYTID